MNVHPLLVHFPIALLTIYSLMEFVRFKFLNVQGWWFWTKAIFVILGSLSTVPTVLAGKIAERNFSDMRYLIRLHSTWAEVTSVIFALIAFCYLVEILNRNVILGFNPTKSLPMLWKYATKLEKIVLESFVIFPLVLAGLVAITVTGALGGTIVYGSNLDPFTNLVYNLLVRN